MLLIETDLIEIVQIRKCGIRSFQLLRGCFAHHTTCWAHTWSSVIILGWQETAPWGEQIYRPQLGSLIALTLNPLPCSSLCPPFFTTSSNLEGKAPDSSLLDKNEVEEYLFPIVSKLYYIPLFVCKTVSNNLLPHFWAPELMLNVFCSYWRIIKDCSRLSISQRKSELNGNFFKKAVECCHYRGYELIELTFRKGLLVFIRIQVLLVIKTVFTSHKTCGIWNKCTKRQSEAMSPSFFRSWEEHLCKILMAFTEKSIFWKSDFAVGPVSFIEMWQVFS